MTPPPLPSVASLMMGRQSSHVHQSSARLGDRGAGSNHPHPLFTSLSPYPPGSNVGGGVCIITNGSPCGRVALLLMVRSE